MNNTALEEFIALQSPNAQAKTLGFELLSDGKPHTTQKIYAQRPK